MKQKIRILILLMIFTGLSFASPLRGEKVPSASGGSAGRPAESPGFYERRALGGLVSGRSAAAGSLRVLFVRVAFSDLGFREGHGDTYVGNELRHLREYYDGASLGAFTLQCDLADETVILPRDEAYYGGNDQWDVRIPEMMITVVDSLDPVYDFSAYDAFAVIHAGAGAETDFNGDSPGQVWSGFIDPDEMGQLLADTLGTAGIPTGDGTPADTFFIDNLMVLPEESSQDGFTFGSLGIYAYQVGKRLGMVALYDPTPSGRSDSQGIGSFGLMSYGLYNALGFVPSFPCAFQRYLLGWVEPVSVGSGGRITVSDINQYSPGDTSIVKVEAGPGEYFLIVNRLHDHDLDRRFDFTDLNMNGVPENEDILQGAEFDFYVTGTTDPSEWIEGVKYTDTGSGIKIWHVDEKIIADRLAAGSSVNSVASFKGVDLEEADGIQDLDRVGGTYAFGSYLDSYRAGVNTAFGAHTNPASTLNGGIGSGIEIENISALAVRMSFDISFGPSIPGISSEVEGDISGSSPVAVPTAGGTDLLLAVSDGDTAKIYRLAGVGDGTWSGEASLIVAMPGTAWAGPPVPADLGGGGGGAVFDGFMISSPGIIHAFYIDGTPYTIDEDASPGSLGVSGENTTAGVAVAHGTAGSDIAFLSSDGDSVRLYIVGVDVPPSSARYAGPGVASWTVCAGTPLSQPALALMEGMGPGIFFAFSAEGTLSLAYRELVPDAALWTGELPGAFEALISAVREYSPAGEDSLFLAVPSSGDIDRDGYDEMVIGLPGTGLVYFDPFDPGAGISATGGEGVTVADKVGPYPSPPALADFDGDGVLETVVREGGYLWILTGPGTIANGWPRSRGAGLSGLESPLVPAQPLAADVDGDGELEAVFNIAGDVYFEEYAGSAFPSSPARGERGEGVPHTITGAGAAGLYLFTAGNVPRMDGPLITGLGFSSGLSTVRRYLLQGGSVAEGAWQQYRRGGTARQSLPAQGASTGGIDEATFICYPNPAGRDGFTVRAGIGGRADVTARLLDLEGNEVRSVAVSHGIEGGSVPLEIMISTDGIASGIYILHLEASGPGWDWSGARKVAVVN
ncbi:MAG TPA: hypothetical protein VLA34_04585 [Candidatus Krumholzibacterium sp.]|nr:hypothetical protein [Candidatus Krumholzibacterium sp.]